MSIIGVYASEQKALAAQQRLATQPGFRDHPEGFEIDAYHVDQDHWAEGFAQAD